MGYRVAVDTGGTFTDFVYLNEETGRVDVLKVPSTRGNESLGILSGLSKFVSDNSIGMGSIHFFAHSTTVGTNTILEENGSKTGLLVTEGFRGIYEVGEQSRGYGSKIYDLFFEKTRPLVQSRFTEEISERILSDGKVLKPLDEEAAKEAIKRLLQRGVESIAVCLLFAFRNGEHERRIAELIREQAPDINISISSEVVPQIREYYRLSTTVVNAYLNPRLESYINHLGATLEDLGVKTKQRYIMRSNGGLATFDTAAQRSVQTILSGPAAGVIAAQQFVMESGIRNIVTFDMGGTSTDVALINDGQPIRRTAGKVNGRDVLVPMLDIHTVAAGGGTIAWIDEAGTLQVGPRSAGAIPGPVCYGRGGTEPTITDANVVLGYLSSDVPLAGGALRLYRKLAEEAIRTRIAEPLGLSVIEAAQGMIEIVNVKMQEAIKVVSSNRGFDLRDFYLFAFGGAGPLHAVQVAKDLRMKGVLIPSYPGVTSALGLLLSDIRHDYVQSDLADIEQVSADKVNSSFAGLAEQGMNELLHEGFSSEQIHFEYILDMRYEGQGYELTISVPRFPLRQEDLTQLRQCFDQEHARLTGHSAHTERVEIMNYRVTGIAKVPNALMKHTTSGNSNLKKAVLGKQEVFFAAEGCEVPLYDRTMLPQGSVITGPAILLQSDTTFIINPEQTAYIHSMTGHIEVILN